MTTDKQTQKETYEAPSMEVIKMENEGVIAASSEGYHPVQTKSYSNRTSTRNYGSASSSDLEDLINDILTIEN